MVKVGVRGLHLSLRYSTCRVLLPAFPSPLTGHTLTQPSFLTMDVKLDPFHGLLTLGLYRCRPLWLNTLAQGSLLPTSSICRAWAFVSELPLVFHFPLFQDPCSLSYLGARFNTRLLKHNALPPNTPWTRRWLSLSFLSWGWGHIKSHPKRSVMWMTEMSMNMPRLEMTLTSGDEVGVCGCMWEALLGYSRCLTSIKYNIDIYLCTHCLWGRSWKPAG